MGDSNEAELVKYRANLKAQLKKEYLQKYWDPYRHASSEGGTVFDPAVQRFISMRACQYDYFKPTKKTSIRGLCIILPFVLFGYATYNSRKYWEEQYSTGQIAYRDRRNKFL